MSENTTLPKTEIRCCRVTPNCQPAALRGRVGYMEDEPEYPDAGGFDAWDQLHTRLWFSDRDSFRIGYAVLRILGRSDLVIVNTWPEGLFLGQLGKGKEIRITNTH